MAQTFGDVMKAANQKRVAQIIKAKLTPPKPNFEDYSGKPASQMNPMRTGAKSTPEVEFAFDATNPAAVEAVRDHAADLITGISNTTRNEIKNLVEQAFTDPEMDVASLADEIENIINDPDRADLIARTETMQAANDGQLDAWDQAQEAGLLTGDEKKEWITTPDDRICPICDDMDGEQVGLDEEFDVDGDSLDGPPAHPNCRCTVGLTS
jgi:SPP1 gp7 family putative phage head morphogenesis protein